MFGVMAQETKKTENNAWPNEQAYKSSWWSVKKPEQLGPW